MTLVAKKRKTMKTNRRKFIETTLTGSVAAIVPGLNFQTGTLKEKYSQLDEILKKPVLKRDLFPDLLLLALSNFKAQKHLSLPGQVKRRG